MPPFRDDSLVRTDTIIQNDGMSKKEKDFSYFVVKNINKTRFIFVDSNRYGIVWINVIMFFVLHIIYFDGLIKLFVYKEWAAWFFGFGYGFLSGIGVTCGAHRLWSHKSYKATLPLRILFMIMHTMAGQNDLYTWCRDHRLHHKFSETDADPHNSNRGFFFTHVGWLLTKKHPDVILKGKTIDCSDLLQDPVIRFQRKYYTLLYLFFCFYFPIAICRYVIGLSWGFSFIGMYGRYVVSLHTTWFVNSAAHMFGDRPFNSKIGARENKMVSFAAWGSEGFHNYHHVFPWDYAISEYGWSFNPMKDIIDYSAKLGLAYDLKRPSPDLVTKVKINAVKNNFVHAYEKPHNFC